MDAKLAKIYYSPRGYWKGVSAIKKLADAAKVPENIAKQWLYKQALWQIYLPAPRYVPRPKFDVASTNSVHTRERTRLLDWIETNKEIKAEAAQNFTNTDYAFKLYNQAHPLPKEPKFSDYYQPNDQQKQGELLFVGGSALAIGYAAFRFL